MVDPRGENIFQLVLPAVPPLVSRQSIGNGAVGGLLQVKVESGFNAQAGLVNLLGAEAFFELPPHLLLKPRGDRHLRLGNAQAQRRVASLLGLGVGDRLVVLHLSDHQVAAAQRFVGIEQGRVGDRPLGQAGQQGGFVRFRSLACLLK